MYTAKRSKKQITEWKKKFLAASKSMNIVYFITDEQKEIYFC
jgi:hypothetical protein